MSNLRSANTGRLHPKLAERLETALEAARRAGNVPSRDEADRQRRRFREKFGPEALGRLDGEALLFHMHERGNHDSLVYWLEFKDDDDLGGWFGSITGGSALKFGVYQSAETQEWKTGTTRKQFTLSLAQAIEIARDQRDKLLAADRVLSEAELSEAPDFLRIQAEIERLAANVGDTIWGHKYLSLLHPELVSAFHAIDYQRYELTKLVQPSTEKRFQNAEPFRAIALELGMTMLELNIALRQEYGAPHLYWRIGTTANDETFWDQMREGSYIAVHWNVPDLSRVDGTPEGREWLKEILTNNYGERTPQHVGREVHELTRFIVTARERDIVVAMSGGTILGVGEILGPYEFVDTPGSDKHRRPVRWLSVDSWKQPEREALRSTFRRLKKPENLLGIEQHLLDAGPLTRGRQPPSSRGHTQILTSGSMPSQPLSESHQRIDSALNRKGQVILYGPPGTGKTYSAMGAAEEILARSWFGTTAAELLPEQRAELSESEALSLISFHPGYGYEDFIEGYRPIKAAAGVAFELRDGRLKRIARRAAEHPSRKFILIIDEINRGDVPRIFGELLTILEKDKRRARVVLPLSGERFILPNNLLIIGTMNTADRSIALLDAALRRRFAFIELMPDHRVLGNASVGSLPLGEWLRNLNERLVKQLGRDARNLQVGHSYLLRGEQPINTAGALAEALRDEIIPLLQEYCYEDYGTLQLLLGKALVDAERQLIRHDALHPSQYDKLVDGLLSAYDQIAASESGVQAQARVEEQQAEDADDADEEDEP